MRENRPSFETRPTTPLRRGMLRHPSPRFSKMSKPPPAPPSLQELRKEIDAIDEQVHRLLMARGDIIDRLIQVKQTQEVGSAFRPAREASMMRRLVRASSRHPAARHHREHLARHHLDLHLCAGAVLGACGCFGRRIRDAGFGAVSFRLRRALSSSHFSAQAAVEAVAKSQGRPGAGLGDLRAARRGGTRWKPAARRKSSPGCRSSNAPIIRPRCRCS